MNNRNMSNCMDCQLNYSEFRLDCLLEDDIWKMIAPEGGLLCANCMVNRIARKIPDVIIVKMTVVLADEYTKVGQVKKLHPPQTRFLTRCARFLCKIRASYFT